MTFSHICGIRGILSFGLLGLVPGNLCLQERSFTGTDLSIVPRALMASPAQVKNRHITITKSVTLNSPDPATLPRYTTTTTTPQPPSLAYLLYLLSPTLAGWASNCFPVRSISPHRGLSAKMLVCCLIFKKQFNRVP